MNSRNTHHKEVMYVRESQIAGLIAIASPEEAAFGEEELRVLVAVAGACVLPSQGDQI